MGGRGSANGGAGPKYNPDFEDGWTPRYISAFSTYEVTKVNGKTGAATEYGDMLGEDVRPMLRGYKYDAGMGAWIKKGSSIAYDITLKVDRIGPGVLSRRK